MRARLYLVPGFFGFTNLGELQYFGHVRNFLAAAAAPVEVEVVRTPPTSSLPVRAARLIEAIAATSRRGDAVHLIGHSSGGLDIRLALSPGASLPTAVDVESVAARVRTAVSVATPHHGTPVASFFTGLLGQRLLQLLSLTTIYVLRFGRLPVTVVLRLGASFARLDRHLGVNSALLDQLFGQLLGDFSAGRRRAIARLLSEVRRDQALLTQLTLEGMDVFNAATRVRPGVRHGSVVTWGRRPDVGTLVAAGLDPSAQATHALYRTLHRLAAASPSGRLRVNARTMRALRLRYGATPPLTANDGLVPTLSQVWGDLIDAVRADHLDVIGHFAAPASVPPHYDWLASGTGFDRTRFEAVWTRVAHWVIAASRRGRSRATPALEAR